MDLIVGRIDKGEGKFDTQIANHAELMTVSKYAMCIREYDIGIKKNMVVILTLYRQTQPTNQLLNLVDAETCFKDDVIFDPANKDHQESAPE